MEIEKEIDHIKSRLIDIEASELSFRDEFAMRAMQGVLSNEELRLKINNDVITGLRKQEKTVNQASIEFEFAKEYYLMADAMLEARK